MYLLWLQHAATRLALSKLQGLGNDQADSNISIREYGPTRPRGLWLVFNEAVARYSLQCIDHGESPTGQIHGLPFQTADFASAETRVYSELIKVSKLGLGAKVKESVDRWNIPHFHLLPLNLGW